MKPGVKKGTHLLVVIGLSCAWAAAQDNDAPYTSQGQGQTTSGYTVPTRTDSKVTVNGDNKTETHSTQRLGINGGYEPYESTQKQTIKVDANTTRVIEKRYGRAPDGSKALLQVIEEETHSSPAGQSVTRTVSNPDINGSLSVTRRELEKTTRSGSDKQEKTTTLMLPDPNGGLSPTLKTQEVDKLDAKGNITEFNRTVSAPQGNGTWQATENTKGTVKRNGDQMTSEELVYRPNTDGKLALAERKVTKETKGADGQQRRVQETYSNMVGGTLPTDDGSLRLEKRVTEVQRADATGKQVREQQVEQRTPAAPSGGLQTTGKTIDIVRPSGQGATQESRTIQSSDGNGGLRTVWVDTTNTQKPSTVNVDTKAKTSGQVAPKSQGSAPKSQQAPPNSEGKPSTEQNTQAPPK
jgi:hypothetical protein